MADTTDVPGPGSPGLVRQFLATEAAGGLVLLAATVVALVWANSPWAGSYRRLWTTPLELRLGGHLVAHDLGHWVNDGLMTLFFFVIGLEIKRELVHGELRDRRAVATPALAAAGGMAAPAALYTLLNHAGPGASGWGIPTATDIAFAMGMLAILGRRVPSSLKVFLLALAIVDDIGAILVIAVFYAGALDPALLLVAGGIVVGMVALRRAGVTWAPLHVALGVGLWLATGASGVHATMAGVILGLLAPTHASTPAAAKDWAGRLLHPMTSFAIVPLFALANAGVPLSTTTLDAPGAGRVAIGVGVGLVVGKTLGITGGAWLAIRLGVGALPAGASWRQTAGVAAVGGIGFTVALFVAGLAFPGAPALEAGAKVGIVIGSVLAAVVGMAVLWPPATLPDGAEATP